MQLHATTWELRVVDAASSPGQHAEQPFFNVEASRVESYVRHAHWPIHHAHVRAEE